jgi:D-aminopeptidase
VVVAVSVDMEGASQLRGVREIFGCFPEYWETGKPRLEADVVAACEGLLAGGATDLVVLDNHGGNTVNVSAESLPSGARLETWNVYDLREHGVEAMFQVGYHARGGVEGFLSHTYLPGLRLRVDGELISESHGRAWAAEVPLLGIVGNDLHQETLGSLERTPYLIVQHSIGRRSMRPVHVEIHRRGWIRFARLPNGARPTEHRHPRSLPRLTLYSRRACRTVATLPTTWPLLAGRASARSNSGPH